MAIEKVSPALLLREPVPTASSTARTHPLLPYLILRVVGRDKRLPYAGPAVLSHDFSVDPLRRERYLVDLLQRQADRCPEAGQRQAGGKGVRGLHYHHLMVMVTRSVEGDASGGEVCDGEVR